MPGPHHSPPGRHRGRLARLSDVLEPTRGHSGPRVSGSTEPALPIGGRILDLIGPLGVPTRLYYQYASLALARRIQPATMPPGADHRVRLALYGLRKHLPWAVQGLDLTELAGVVDGLARDLASAVAGADRALTVPCPAQLPDGGDCTGRLRYDDTTRTASCRSCRTVLAPSQWLEHALKIGYLTA
ncbi:hypothetical protein D3C59_35120 [Streptomyces sp. SHP22-7]|nr:hypothetical protein D3C59_35120 [Streptomyces sp. SHP22-7]